MIFMLRLGLLLGGLCGCMCGIQSLQAAVFFTNGSRVGYYDSGLAFPNGASSLKQAGPSGDKIPTTTTQSYSTPNALEISWTSRANGDWAALVIAPGFPFLDISQDDFLSFWVYSEEGMAAVDLPLLYFEGAPGNQKSSRFPLSDFTGDIPAGVWTRVVVPLSTYVNDLNQTNIQFEQIKAVIFGQDQADGAPHTLLIDEVRTYAASTDPIETPAGFSGEAFDSHVELNWTAKPYNNVTGYHLYRSDDEGQTFRLLRFVNLTDSLYLDFMGPDNRKAYQYYLAGVSNVGNESPATDTLVLETREFSDDELLEMVQRYTFRYFWDFGHPTSGLSRERNTSGNLVTIGGSGFGVMAILVGIERGYITRAQGKARLERMVNFLANADRFHGAWPHWMDGRNGETIPFSQFDNGGDLVETAFMIQGLLTARQYFNQMEDSLLQADIMTLWRGVEWNWYRKQVQKELYWHWSPEFGFQINFALRGFNEVHITYLLAIAAPRHSVPASLYRDGWASRSAYTNGNSYYGWPLSVGQPFGGPLFFAHYSYLGFDPRGIRDDYANYYIRNKHHTYINRAWCVDNPLGHEGYGELGWGLTASDNPFGYLAHEPSNTRDNGTITPTAALGSMPYTPEFSIPTLKYFYRDLGERLWGPMGFYDAYNMNEDWVASSYLAIDQGPIILMIENHRTGLLWEYFMKNPEIQPMLDAVGFVPDSTTSVDPLGGDDRLGVVLYPMPTEGMLFVKSWDAPSEPIQWTLYTLQGKAVGTGHIRNGLTTGEPVIRLGTYQPGTYLIQLTAGGKSIHQLVQLKP